MINKVQDHRSSNAERYTPSKSGIELPVKVLPKIDFNLYAHVKTFHSRVMVKEVKVDYSESKIILDTKEGRPSFTQGVVVSVGTGYPDNNGVMRPLDFQIGDFVYFSDMSGVDFKVATADGKFDDVKVVDTSSIYYLDNTQSHTYEDVTLRESSEG